jgi:thiamine-phosphate pyrophosphorylase
MFNKLQYISQGETVHEQLYNIHQALDNGCDWIQLRFKKASTLELFTLAEAVKFLCEEYLATFIINDNVYLAQQLAADGVHLGLQDMSVLKARELLGNSKIIGGTANTFEDIIHRVEENCDYIGLGPFQFTETKANLSPLLGIEGYKTILEKIKQQNISIPVYAIGGITLDDVENLMNTGIHGIAMSGLITSSPNQKKLISQLHKKLYVNI